MSLLALTIVGIVLVLAFDFTNGFHDASNMLGTLVASRAMTPAQAVSLVGVFTFVGPLLGGTAVADTLGGVVELQDVGQLEALVIVLSGVAGAIVWNLVTWRLAMPSSSSHALVGGLVGAVLVAAGASDVNWGFDALQRGHVEGVAKILLALMLSPLLGFAFGFAVHRASLVLLRAASPRANGGLRRAQWLTAGALAFSHGTNDAQKGMGIIALVLLVSGRETSLVVPVWVIALSALSITMGTLLGGWRIVRTVGYGIYRLRPLHGLNAQVTSASVILAASAFGGPVSTTHVVSSAIMGIGASEQPRRVHWARAREIMLTWVLTLPGAALVGATLCALVRWI